MQDDEMYIYSVSKSLLKHSYLLHVAENIGDETDKYQNKANTDAVYSQAN